jgi:protein O-mannosyl-transferase
MNHRRYPRADASDAGPATTCVNPANPSNPNAMTQPTSAARPTRFSLPILIVLVLLCLGRLVFAEFTWWDDAGTVHHNNWLNPPTLNSLKYYWTTPTAGLYVPVTYTVWIALAAIAGVDRPDDFGVMLNPVFFHGASVLLHLASTWFVLIVLRRLVRSEWPAFFGAAFFAVHPMQVETVAWVSGLKDILAWCLSLATVVCYLKAVDRQKQHQRSLWRGPFMPGAALLLSLALLSKPNAMVTPAALVVLDVLLVRKRSLIRALIDLWPLFVLSIAAAVVARQAQDVHHIYQAPLWHRPFVAADALTFYLRQLVWPATLTIDHGRRPQDVMRSPLVYVYFVFILAMTVVLFRLRRREPTLAAAGAVFVIGVGPVLGLATFQMQYYSTVTDHYLYFSMLGPALVVAWLLHRWPGPAAKGLATMAIAALGVRTFVQTAVWQDSFTLFAHAMRSTPKSAMPHSNLGVMYLSMMQPQIDKAEPLFDRAYELDPTAYFVLDGYGQVKLLAGKPDDARRAWAGLRKFMDQFPNARDINTELAVRIAHRWMAANELDEAQEWLDVAATYRPENRALLNTRAMLKRIKADRAATSAATSATTRPATKSTAPAPASPPAR